MSRFRMPLLESLGDLSTRSRTARATLHMIAAYTSRGQTAEREALAASSAFMEAGWPLYAAEALELCERQADALSIYRTSGATASVARLTVSKTRAAGVLTARELEVAKLVAQGKSNRSIADDLVLSERTIENHVASIFTKLNLRSRAELAAVVARKGLTIV